jgi:hypothetical protein
MKVASFLTPLQIPCLYNLTDHATSEITSAPGTRERSKLESRG